jgi:Mg2+-importing ATPase
MLKLVSENYWLGKTETLLKELKTSEKGLTKEEASKRLNEAGLNVLQTKKNQSLILSFLSKFLNPLIIILLFASLLTAFLGELTHFLIIAAIILISVTLDFYQQYQAQEAADKLNKRISLTAMVYRNNQKEEIPVSHITLGDIIILSAGDIIPADARLLESNDLLVSESALTGESLPIEKDALASVHENATVSQRINCIFMGTNVISGEAVAVVIAIGKDSEYGKIAGELAKKRPESEFTSGIKQFGYLLMRLTFALVIIVFFTNAFIKHEVLNSFLFALALAIGLTPELLPMVITTNLSRGAVRMSKKGVIVKNLPAIENFGSMEILCTDKTGTLTEDHIRLERYEDISTKENTSVLLYGFLNSHFQTGIKSPLEQAILSHKQEIAFSHFKRIDEIPFDFNRKMLSIIVSEHSHQTMVTKGAPEEVLKKCHFYFKGEEKHELSDTIKKKIHQRFHDLSLQGFRVLAIATKPIHAKDSYTTEDESELVFLGLMAFLDPPKESAGQALLLLKTYGIEIKILTGDSELVTQKVCSDLGLEVKDVVTGEHLKNLTSEQLFHLVRKTTIFARLNPMQKEQIILSLKKHNVVVGYMGDGINDAPSLQAADIGISVNNAVDVAKESADMILLRKDLHVLKDGILEGRKTYGNIMKYIMMGTSSNFGNMFSVAGASIILPFLPMLPIQILLNNLLYDLSQLTISSDHIDTDYLKLPKKWDIGSIKHFMLIFGPISSLSDFLTFFILLKVLNAQSALFQTGWFVESLLSQTIIIFSIRTSVVPFFKSKPSLLLVISSIIVAIIALILPFSPVANLFSFVAPPIRFYIYLPFIMFFYLFSVEIAKLWFHKSFTLEKD